MTRIALTAALVGLAACGVDGEPTTPTTATKAQTAPAGISVTGRAEIGVAGSR